MEKYLDKFIQTLLIGMVSFLVIGAISAVIHFLFCDISGYDNTFFCLIFSGLQFLLNFLPLSVIVLALLFYAKLYFLLTVKFGLFVTLVVLGILGFVFYLVAPGNLDYLILRALKLNI